MDGILAAMHRMPRSNIKIRNDAKWFCFFATIWQSPSFPYALLDPSYPACSGQAHCAKLQKMLHTYAILSNFLQYGFRILTKRVKSNQDAELPYEAILVYSMSSSNVIGKLPQLMGSLANQFRQASHSHLYVHVGCLLSTYHN